jgi:hypothetical protein
LNIYKNQIATAAEQHPIEVDIDDSAEEDSTLGKDKSSASISLAGNTFNFEFRHSW